MLDLEKILASGQLPSLPTVAVRSLELARNRDVDLAAVAAVIQTDPALTARILQATNSAFFGLSGKVTSVQHAVVLLGATRVISLVLSFSLLQVAHGDRLSQYYRQYWRRSLTCAAACDLLGRRLDALHADDYFVAGLLQDVGSLALMKAVPRAYLPILEALERGEGELVELERAQLGFDHGELGARLLEKWGLASNLVEATARHHWGAPATSPTARRPVKCDLHSAMAASAAIGDLFCLGTKASACRSVEGWLAAFGLEGSAQEHLLQEVRGRVEQAADLLSFDLGPYASYAEIMAEANGQLSRLVLEAQELSARVEAQQTEIRREKEQLEAQVEDLKGRALRDSLTGVYNRHYFEEDLKREYARAARYGDPLGVLFMDVDHFKMLNDRYGHPFGDEVLRRVAAAMEACIRRTDVLARYGGEEFVALISRVSQPGLERFAERIRAGVEFLKLEHQGRPVRVTMSVGAALDLPGRDDAERYSELVAAADRAMYDAKQAGRNRAFCVSLLDPRERRLTSEVEARRFTVWLSRKAGVDADAIEEALAAVSTKRELIGELAVRYRYVGAAQVEEILRLQHEGCRRFGEVACELGYLDDERLIRLLVLQRENPKAIARILSACGVISESRADALVQRYLREGLVKPAPEAVGAR